MQAYGNTNGFTFPIIMLYTLEHINTFTPRFILITLSQAQFTVHIAQSINDSQIHNKTLNKKEQNKGEVSILEFVCS